MGENIELSLPVYISPLYLISIFPLPDFRLTNVLFACLHTCAHMYLFLESYWSKQYNIYYVIEHVHDLSDFQSNFLDWISVEKYYAKLHCYGKNVE